MDSHGPMGASVPAASVQVVNAAGRPGPRSIWSGLMTIQVDKGRRESILLAVLYVIMFIFEICSAVVVVFAYSGPNGVSITISHNSIQLCTGGSANTCVSSSLGQKLCAPMSQRVQTAGSFAIFGIFLAVIGFALTAAECTGRVVARYAIHIVSVIFWFILFIQWILDAAAFNEYLCSGNSLKNLGFTYQAGFALGFVSWIFLSVALIYYVCRRKIDPVKEHGQYEVAAAPPRVRQL